MNILVALLIALIGLLLYLIATNAKLAEIGRILFFVGALIATAQFGARAVHLL